VDTISFYLSKILWAFFSPAHFVVILFLLSFFVIKSPFFKTFVRGFAGLFLCLALLFPIGDWALVPLETCTAEHGMPMRVDGVIVLGGGVNIRVSDSRNAIAFNDSSERIIAMLKLIKQYPNAQIVYTGGSSSLKHTEKGEADYVKQFLEDYGLNTANMAFQNKSRNTFEDAMLTQNMYGVLPKQNWLLVTSAYHMPRTLGLFMKAGEKSETHFYPYAVDFKTPEKIKFELRVDMLQTLLKLDTAAHEYVGLIVNKILSRSDSIMSCVNSKSKTLE
jgi:uncharacterized SAM-binding protein YcdF (DUF218 family)